MTEWRLFWRSTALERTAELTDSSLSFDAVLRHNDAGSWLLSAPADDPSIAAVDFAIGAGIVLTRDGVTVMSGPLRQLEEADTSEGRTLQAAGVDDTGLLGYRLAVPTPGYGTATAHHTLTGPVEDVLRGYVDANCGPTARADRRIPYLVVAESSARGSTVTGAARWDNLLELIAGLARAGGGVRFQIRQSDTVAQRLDFLQTWPVDKSTFVTFDRNMGNLGDVVYAESAAEVNSVVVAGQGEMTDRVWIERSNSTSVATYGLVESFRDARQTEDLAELQQAAEEDLSAGAGGFEITFQPIDTGSAEYGVDYDLGDKVGVRIGDTTIVALVTSVELSFRGGLVTVVPTVSTLSIAADPGGNRPASRLARRVTNLETSGITAWIVGMIVAWDSALAIPYGWAVCDGTNGTPDLRDRFLVGVSGTKAAGSTGGAASGTVNIAAHTHTATAHTHSMSHTHITDFEATDDETVESGTGDEAANVTHGHFIASSAMSTASGGAVATASGGASTPSVATLPPYYAVIWIRRMIS